jgi:hypothetical protein
MYEELSVAKTKLAEVTKVNFDQDIEIKRLTFENDGFKKDNERL